MNLLNKLLANIAIAKQNATNLHWNVRGPLFWPLHKITEKLYEGLNDFIDDVAEKVAMQGEMPLSTYKEYIDNADIKEIKPKAFNVDEVIKHVVDDLNIVQKSANLVKSTDVIQPLLDEIYLFIDKQRWIFNSHKV